VHPILIDRRQFVANSLVEIFDDGCSFCAHDLPLPRYKLKAADV
jgi:hypothetical protein